MHVHDAATATVLAVEQQAEGIFNVVDDEPAAAAAWLPHLAACAGAKRPLRVPVWLARLMAGDVAVALDPPPAGDPASLPGRGFAHLAWGPAEIEFALAVWRAELDLRPALVVAYRALRDANRPLGGEELERALVASALDIGAEVA